MNENPYVTLVGLTAKRGVFAIAMGIFFAGIGDTAAISSAGGRPRVTVPDTLRGWNLQSGN